MARYQNPHIRSSKKSLWHFLLWKVGYYNKTSQPQDPPLDFTYPISLEPFNKEAPSALWIGHSSFFINVHGVSLLTDPVWDDYCSPIPLAAFKRKIPPPIALSELPPIDMVLLSHNHYDHLDRKTVAYLKEFHPQIQWIVPKGLSSWFQRRGIERVKELGWWEDFVLPKGKVTAVPAQHFSGRGLWDKNKTHWNGYVFEVEDKRLYFVGDTGYNPYDFKEIGKRWTGMDLSLIPIGTYVPEEFMKPVHIGPVEAVQIHQEVQSKLSIGMHWKTFRLSDEHIDSPPYDLYLAMQRKGLAPSSFLPLHPGRYVNW